MTLHEVTKMTDLQEFAKYCSEFYSDVGIYPMGATHEEILIATGVRMQDCKNMKIEFCGDSFDRESVRDIILGNRI